MKSPYDMVGYDRQVLYVERPRMSTYVSLSDDGEDDSDVAVVASSVTSPTSSQRERRAAVPEVIQVDSDSSRDSDVVLGEEQPPLVVDLVSSDDEKVKSDFSKSIDVT